MLIILLIVIIILLIIIAGGRDELLILGGILILALIITLTCNKKDLTKIEDEKEYAEYQSKQKAEEIAKENARKKELGLIGFWQNPTVKELHKILVSYGFVGDLSTNSHMVWKEENITIDVEVDGENEIYSHEIKTIKITDRNMPTCWKSARVKIENNKIYALYDANYNDEINSEEVKWVEIP